MKAHLIQEESVRNKVNSLLSSGQNDEAQEMKRYLGALELCRSGLSWYSDIDLEDKEAVAYFNTAYRKITGVPEDRRRECGELVFKYMSRGTSESSDGIVGKLPEESKTICSLTEKSCEYYDLKEDSCLYGKEGFEAWKLNKCVLEIK